MSATPRHASRGAARSGGRRGDRPGVPSRRLATAVAAIFAFAAACVGVDEAIGAFGQDARADAGLSSDAGERVRASEEPGVPLGFEEEVLTLEGRSEVMAAADGTVVGFVEDGASSEVFGDIESELGERGWAKVDSGVEGFASFFKSGGKFTWAFVSCVPVGGATSVVIQCPPVEGG